MLIPIVQTGDRHPLVTILKRRFGMGRIDDLYDAEIQARVRGMQVVRGLEAHGQIDKETLEALGIHDDTYS